MPYTAIRSRNLFYTVTKGPEDGPAMALIHGAGGSRLHWPPQLRRLCGATVYTLDLPGHGRSDGPGSETIRGYAAAVAAFIERVVARPAVVVGHSMGGAVAQTLALEEPECVSSVVLVGTGARLRVDPAILDGIQMDFSQTVDLITRYAWAPGVGASLRELGREALRETGSDVLLKDFLACDRFDVMDRLGGIKVAALVIGGSADQLTPLKYSRFLSKHIPNAQLVTVEGAGHMVMLERPEEVTGAIKAFLT